MSIMPEGDGPYSYPRTYPGGYPGGYPGTIPPILYPGSFPGTDGTVYVPYPVPMPAPPTDNPTDPGRPTPPINPPIEGPKPDIKPGPSTAPPTPPSTGELVGRLIGGLIGNAVQGRNVLDPRGFPAPPSLLGGVVGSRRPNDLREQVLKIIEENKKAATGTPVSRGGVLTGETPDMGEPEQIELEVIPFEDADRETVTDFLFKRAGAADVGKGLGVSKDYQVGPGATPILRR